MGVVVIFSGGAPGLRVQEPSGLRVKPRWVYGSVIGAAAIVRIMD